MTGRLRDKVAVIIGGASGICRATALAMAAEGARIAIMDVGADRAKDVIASFHSQVGEARNNQTNVALATDVTRSFDKVIADFGRIDCAFNNAGVAGDNKMMADTMFLANV